MKACALFIAPLGPCFDVALYFGWVHDPAYYTPALSGTTVVLAMGFYGIGCFMQWFDTQVAAQIRRSQ